MRILKTMEEDEVAEIRAAHFVESMKYARRSVHDSDIQFFVKLETCIIIVDFVVFHIFHV